MKGRRHLQVSLVVAGEVDGLGAETFGLGHGHSGVEAVGAGFVGGAGDDAALVGADDDGPAFQ